VRLQREGVSLLKVTVRGFLLWIEDGEPLCRWTTTTREIHLLPNKTYSFAGLLAPQALSSKSLLLKGYASLADTRAELILLIEEQ
jgi:hypothetical protein